MAAERFLHRKPRAIDLEVVGPRIKRTLQNHRKLSILVMSCTSFNIQFGSESKCFKNDDVGMMSSVPSLGHLI